MSLKHHIRIVWGRIAEDPTIHPDTFWTAHEQLKLCERLDLSNRMSKGKWLSMTQKELDILRDVRESRRGDTEPWAREGVVESQMFLIKRCKKEPVIENCRQDIRNNLTRDRSRDEYK